MVSWKYSVGVLEIFFCVLEIFYWHPVDILWVFWRNLMIVLEIFYLCN